MPEIKYIGRSVLDRDFRAACKGLIKGANESIHLIAGELGSLKLIDIQNAFYEATTKKDVSAYAYATERTAPEMRNYAVSLGFELWIGKKSLPDHYLVIDRKHYVRSMNKRLDAGTQIGERIAEVHLNDPEGAEKIIKGFENLKQDAEKISSVDKKLDPFYQFLQSV